MCRKTSSNVSHVIQNSFHSDSDPGDGDSSLDNLQDWTGEWCEQPTLFSEGGVENFFEHESSKKRPSATWYTQRDLDEGALILGILRDSNSRLTKIDLAVKRYPEIFFQMSSYAFIDPLGKTCDVSKKVQQDYVAQVGRCLRSISDSINRKLDDLEENRSSQLAYLKTVSLAIPVDKDRKGRALYVYHGPELPQPLEVLEQFITWAENHQDRNGRLFRLATNLSDSICNASGEQLNNEYYPSGDTSDGENIA